MEFISNPMKSVSILVVEDEVITLEYLATTLTKKFPYVTLYKAHNGKTGLELFKTHTPDIVITDINMPEMGGEQLAANIHLIRRDTKFIILTGKSGELVFQDSDPKGFEFDHIIVKPVVFQELFAAVDQCIDEIEQNRL